MPTVALLAALLAVATGFAAASLRTLDRQAQALDMPSRRRFLAEFDGETVAGDVVPANVLVETYEALGRRLAGRGEQVTRGARLADDLGLSAADVEDVALLVAARCDGRLPHAADLDALDRSVHTVGDLVAFVVPFCRPPVPAAPYGGLRLVRASA